LLKLLFASAEGVVMEHPQLLATVRSGEDVLPAMQGAIGLPTHAKLVQLPGRRPIGIDPATGRMELVREVATRGKRVSVSAVGALLPPGFTRTFLPGAVYEEGPLLPQWAYAAAAWTKEGPVTWALRTDRRTHWNPSRYSTADLPARVNAHLQRFPGNPLLVQLQKCALTYRCFTSQNIFYVRDEGAIAASVACNAHCVGCISEQPKDGPPASHQRIEEGPSAEAMAEVGAYHLAHASGRAMISFGQGCEGEPLTRHRAIAQAIRLIRKTTSRGSININTNGSLSDALDALLQEGLDAVRVSLNSAVKDLYECYYQPIGYGWDDVEASLALARRRRAYIALNLLVFPGVTDRLGEVEALVELVRRHRIDQVQTRSLAIDPMQYLEAVRGRGAPGPAIGVEQLIRRLKQAAPWLVIGNFARGLTERLQYRMAIEHA
jgi:pyruvate-formate lyase-activating enzyme